MSKATNKDQLFELIKSLSKSEKRYFKLYVSRHTTKENNNYTLLFDYLDKAGDYIEKEVFKHFKKEAFINNFSITKRRLYDQIISSLNAYHSRNSIDALLYKNLQGAAILYQKSLYSQAEKLLNSAHKLASKHERMALLIEIEHKQQQLIETRHYSSVKKEELDKRQLQHNEILHQVHLQSELWFTKSLLFVELNKKGLLRDNHHREKLNEYHSYINQLTGESALSTSNAYLFHHIEAAYYFTVGDYKNSMMHLSANIDLLEANLLLLQEFPNYYFGTLSNAVYVAGQLNMPAKANELLQKIKTFPSKYNLELSDDLLLKMFLSTSSTELSMLISRGEFISALKIIPVIENGIKLHEEKIPVQKRLFFSYKFAGIHIGIGNFSGALKWVNHILCTPNLDSNNDIIAFTHILNLILHLELKNDQLLPYTLKNTQRYLKKRNRLYSFEKMILQFIARYNREKKDFNEKRVWEELYQEIVTSKDTPDYRIISEYFDFETWAQSKICNQRFDDLIRLKHKERAAHL